MVPPISAHLSPVSTAGRQGEQKGEVAFSVVFY